MSSWKPELTDFDLVNAEPLGCGAISQVVKAKHKESGKFFAIKVISKIQITQQKKVDDVMREKQALYALNPHPFITTIFATLQSADELYFVMEWLPHGDLREYVTRHGPMGFRSGRCLLAQVVVALEKIFSKGMTMRDLKAENIGFSADYRVKVFDFDTCAMPAPATGGGKGKNMIPVSNGGEAIPQDDHPSASANDDGNSDPGAEEELQRKKKEKRRMTVSEIKGMSQQCAAFCGTAQYVSPEMLGTTTWSYSSDLWALGVLAYFVFTGLHIFEGLGSFQVMQQIVRGAKEDEIKEVMCGKYGQPVSAAEFVIALLKTDPTLRLGVHRETKEFDPKQLREHKIFEGLQKECSLWSRLDFCVMEESSADPRDNKMMDPMRPNQEEPQRSFREYFYPRDSGTAAATAGGGAFNTATTLPNHTAEYAKYVFEAPTSAFEEWVLNGGKKKDDEAPAKEGEGEDEGEAPAPESKNQSKATEDDDDEPCSRTVSSDSSGDIEIIDDQGISGSEGPESDLPMFVQRMQQGDGTQGAPTAFAFPMEAPDKKEEDEGGEDK